MSASSVCGLGFNVRTQGATATGDTVQHHGFSFLLLVGKAHFLSCHNVDACFRNPVADLVLEIPCAD